MKRAAVLFMVLFPPLTNVVAAFRGGDLWWTSALTAVFLAVFTVVIWRKYLYVMWLGLPMSSAQWAWPSAVPLSRKMNNPAAVHLGILTGRVLKGSALPFAVLAAQKAALELAGALLQTNGYLKEHPDFMSGRTWRKVVPKMDRFVDAYVEGFAYGAETTLPDAFTLWEESGFDDRFTGYMRAVGPADAVGLMTTDIPIDYAVAMRGER